MCCLVTLSCREIQPVLPPVTVHGYQINGTVSTSNGIPLDSVDVRLYYRYQLFSTSPIDTQTVYVADSTKILDISVYTVNNVFVRNLFFGFRRIGVVPRARWDGVDDDGKAVPSGKYIIRYVVDTAIVKQSATVVEGHSTAMSDATGRFTITNDHFPIGDIFDFYDSQGAYVESDMIISNVDLELRKSNLYETYPVELINNQITSGVFILQ
jgi:hypothetical protein